MSLFDRKTVLDDGISSLHMNAGWDPRDTLSDTFDVGLGWTGVPNPFASPDMPEAPDYEGAAEATAAGDLEMAKYATGANRPNQYTPFGSTEWSQDADDYWSQTTTLSPEQQAILESQQTGDLLSSQMGIQGLQATGDMFSTPYTSGLDPMESYGDQRTGIIDAMMARTDTDVSRARESKRSQLVAQGIPVGSEAYQREMEQLDRRLTDAKQQAEIYATDQISTMTADDRATRNQMISELLTERQTPLNEYSALTSGAPVSNPAFENFYTQQPTQGADYLTSAIAQGNWDLAGWNADVAGQNALWGAGADLGSAYLTGGA